MKRITHLMLALTLVVFSLSSLAKEQEWPEITEDGLQRVHDARLAVVYITPGADLGVYGKVMISEPSVAFKKNWDRDMRSRSASKLSTSSRVNTTKIRKDLAQEFETVFTDKLSSGGYDVVTEAGDDVLLISPAIVNLDINAPQTSGAGRTNQYVRSAGEMTLYLELYDSVTGDLIAKALDRQVDREHNEVMTWANSSTNKAAAERILNGWADILLEALNEARAYPNPEAPASE